MGIFLQILLPHIIEQTRSTLHQWQTASQVRPPATFSLLIVVNQEVRDLNVLHTNFREKQSPGRRLLSSPQRPARILGPLNLSFHAYLDSFQGAKWLELEVFHSPPSSGARLRLNCDGTRAETRFRLSAKRTIPFKSAGASVQSTTGSRRVRISCSNAGYTMFRGSVKGTGYPLHSPVSPSLPLPCVTLCHHVSTVYLHPFGCPCLHGMDNQTFTQAIGVMRLNMDQYHS